MADDRNFRSYYYEKFGFRATDEKKSIEVLLKEQPLDVEKLRLFCLRFPVSVRYRVYLWKLLLGVLPASKDSHDFVMSNRTEQYQQLKHALSVMRRVNDNTPMPEIFLKMYLMESGLLPMMDEGLLELPANRVYMKLASAVSSMMENNVDTYWVTSRFYVWYRKNYLDAIPKLPEKVNVLLKREDPDHKLWNQLEKHNLWSDFPLMDWFNCCFAGSIPDASFERIGDIVLGGSLMFLVYVAVAIFMTLRRPLLVMNSREEILKYLMQIPEDSGDIFVSKAIDMWEKHGHHLAKSDSPGPINRSPT